MIAEKFNNGFWPFRLVDNVLSPPQFFFLFFSDDMSLSCRGQQLISIYFLKECAQRI